MNAADGILGTTAEQRGHLVERIARYLPAPLVSVFTADVMCSHLLFEEFVHRLILQVCAETDLGAAAGEWSTVDEVVARSGFDPPHATAAVGSILRHLAARGVLASEDLAGAQRFRAEHELPTLDPAPVRAEQQQHDPACLPSYVIADAAARDYPAFLRGKREGEDILLAPTRLPLWVAYFSNANPLYEVNNRVGAVAVETWMPPAVGTILEIGGGCASGTTALLERLAAVGRLGDVSRYRFTELVPAFLRRGQRIVEERFAGASGLTFEPLDMNRPFAPQGVPPESVSIVYAVNTLHVAHDLAFTLAEVRRALEPGGQLIISECVRPFAGQTLYPEFVFNLMATFRAPRLHPGYRPNGGFLTTGQWASALQTADFSEFRVLPDVASIHDVFPTFYAAALGATRGA